MSQTFTDDCFNATHAALTDLQYFEDNFAALKSNFSGTAAPANATAGQFWYDSTKMVMKMRNSSNDTWYGVMHGSTASKIWMYRNDALQGWAITTAVADCVIGLKAQTSGAAFYASGGTTVGTWTQPDHVLTTAEIPAHTHDGGLITYRYATAAGTTGATAIAGASALPYSTFGASSYSTYVTLSSWAYQVSVAAEGGSTAHSHGSTWRPSAALGTLQYLDL
jgi:hypothetical protein